MIIIRCNDCDVQTLAECDGTRRVERPRGWTHGDGETYGGPQSSEDWCPRCTKRREARRE